MRREEMLRGSMSSVWKWMIYHQVIYHLRDMVWLRPRAPASALWLAGGASMKLAGVGAVEGVDGGGLPAGELQEFLEEEGAGDGVVEGVMGGAAGGEGLEAVGELHTGDEIFKFVGAQFRIGNADELEGIDPLPGRMQWKRLHEIAVLGGGVVRHQRRPLNLVAQLRPQGLQVGGGFHLLP